MRQAFAAVGDQLALPLETSPRRITLLHRRRNHLAEHRNVGRDLMRVDVYSTA
ncbi:MAG: hypothetical protein JWQ90_2445 [Hydrocarboniphaga sp.]|nr:hypothetical protein [Hydrocarboniphaga sp.]